MIKQNKKMKGGDLKMKKNKIEKKERGLKEFFKPTKWKIIIFLILIVLAYINFSIIASTSCDFTGCNYKLSNILLFIFVYAIENFLSEKFSWILLIVSLALQVVYLYIFACIIISIYGLIKKGIKNARRKK